MSDKVKFASNPSVRRFARMAMAALPRGGGDAEQIRMGWVAIVLLILVPVYVDDGTSSFLCLMLQDIEHNEGAWDQGGSQVNQV